MFELFFKYPSAAYAKGDLQFLGGWPVWLLFVLTALAAVGLAWPIWRSGLLRTSRTRAAILLALQTAFVALLLMMLWQPALSVPSLRTQQNIVAVVVDNSQSMRTSDAGGRSRLEAAVSSLNSGVLDELRERFQVRLFQAGAGVDRVDSLAKVDPSAKSTQLGEALRNVAGEAASLPFGAIIVLSDGADNAGGIDLATTEEIRRYRVPVHTVGFGQLHPERDIEVTKVDVPMRTMAGSRVNATVTLRQYGYANRPVRITAKDGEKVLASAQATLKADGEDLPVQLMLTTGQAGARSIQLSVDPADGESNRDNNSVTRLINVDGIRPRVLYIEGDPKWEYKFIRRAIELDQGLELVSMLRTTQNKVYRQGIKTPDELQQGFPATVEELFDYQAVIIGGIEAGAFTPAQQELLKQFVDRRGGGLLWLAGRSGLSDGGWAASSLAELMPVALPNSKNTFRREPATVRLTEAGRDSVACRLVDDPAKNAERWKALPYLANYQNPGTPKPGAVVLADFTAGRSNYPLFVTQPYGRGRTAVLATSGTWRWQMQQPLADGTHETFWQQMLRWLVGGTEGRVISSLPKSVFSDVARVPLRAEVRDKNYLPAADARVEARILGPGGLSETVELRPDETSPGVYIAEYSAVTPGSYVTEVVAWRGEEEAGRDAISFRREDGVAERFGMGQNRELLQKVSQSTGGRYWKPEELKKLPEEVTFSESGISVRETRELWNLPLFFLLAILLRGGEWILRRRWGAV
jgi:uncharacterized membrane protein